MPLPSTPPPAVPSPSPESVLTLSAASSKDVELIEPNSTPVLQVGVVLDNKLSSSSNSTNSLHLSTVDVAKHPSTSQQNLQQPETTLQKSERKAREMLMQITHGLSDLSRLHTAAVAGQQRFKQGLSDTMNIYL